ncbi:hypothetical protein LFM09_14560 [Lentzea alba]|uniref:hypothetical protein n=1 Tax=Lentzea alba TaxID=2714351 RepID=UPI0039BFE23D
MKRPVIAGAAVLCLVAAPAAQAAWETSAPGQAKAKAGTVQPLVITSCAKGNTTVVNWEPVPGASMYTVLWQQGSGSGAEFKNSATTQALTYSVTDSLNRVRVQAAVGSWTTSYTEKICS